MSEDLKPCPFCAGPTRELVLIGDKWSVLCGCDAEGPWAFTKELAVGHWNKRASPPGGEWQGIESYDGEPDEWVWAIRGKIPFVAAWDAEEGWYTFNRYFESDFKKPFVPTHYMPLPAPPREAVGVGIEGSSVARVDMTQEGASDSQDGH